MPSIRDAVSQGMLSSREAKEDAVFQLVRLVGQRKENDPSDLMPELVWIDIDEKGKLSLGVLKASMTIRNRMDQLIEYSAPERLFDDYYEKLGYGIDAIYFSLGLLIYYLYYGKSYYEQMRERVTDIPPTGTQKAQGSLICIQDCGAMPKAVAQGVEQLTSFLGDRKRGISLIENFEREKGQGEVTPPERGQKQDLSRLWIGVSLDGKNDDMLPILRLDGAKGLVKKIREVQTIRSVMFWKVDFSSKQKTVLREIQLESMPQSESCDLMLCYDPDSRVCHVELRGARNKSWQFPV